MTSAPAKTSYPAVLERVSGELHELRSRPTFVVGRSQDADLPLLDMNCSRRQFQLVNRGSEYVIEPLSTKCQTFLNGNVLNQSHPLSHGARITAGTSEFVFLLREDSGPAERPARDRSTAMPQVGQPPPPPPGRGRGERGGERDDRTVHVDNVRGHRSDSGEDSKLPGTILIRGAMLIGRDKQRVGIHLAHSQVSRLHAQIIVRDKSATVSDLNSANGTFVNGTRIQGTAAIKLGDRIDIGPYALIFHGNSLVPQSRVNNVELAGRHITQVVKNRETGKSLTLLDDVSLVIHPREFVCFLGPSGCGKSTLLSALSARKPASKGTVSINSEDLYSNFDALKRDIAVVPQKDVLHEFLSVSTALRYTARMRLPPDTTSEEIDTLVSDMLKTVGLTNEANKQIRDLSGGQARRASLANEIISKPSLLFLDEVTSGLDEETDEGMMRLFREIANDGKTVVCITHSLAHVEAFCDRVVILAKGGNLAFIGTPREATEYFKVDRLGRVYGALNEKAPEQWKRAFQQHPNYKKHVSDYFEKHDRVDFASPVRNKPTFVERLLFLTRQCGLLTGRYLRAQLADYRSLMMTLGQCLLVGLLVVLLFGDVTAEAMLENEELPSGNFSWMNPDQFEAHQTAQIMFLLAISVLWFGCNNSAKEIVKEKVIYSSERDVNLAIPSYLTSKILLLGLISLIQALLLITVVKFGTGVTCGLSELIMLATLAFTGVAMGLLVSAVSQTTDMAVTIVPLILIPQIIFSGVIAEVEGFAKLLASLSIVIYWGHGGLVALQPEEMRDMLGYEDWSAVASWLIITFHAFVYLTAAFVILHLASSREPVYRKAIDKLLSSTRGTVAKT